jgi:reverse transcriptase-like protein
LKTIRELAGSGSARRFNAVAGAQLTIYQTLLSRGYFPKEFPPAFFTEQFARYSTTKLGRSALLAYKPAENFTECFKFHIGLPGLDRRELRIPHPFSFAKLAQLTSKNFSRLLRAASRSTLSRSRPVYATDRQRAIQPMVRPANLARERVAARAGSRFLLRADVSQFYPSLYTHAVGWALDPKLRKRANWQNKALLGKNVDQLLMDLDGKLSQGIPVGNDISFLLAEVVLAQVDRELGVEPRRAYRWFDDYGLAFDTRAEAEMALKKLSNELGRFQLRLNPKKTMVVALPHLAADDWQAKLSEAGARGLDSPEEMLSYFDMAFSVRAQFPDSPVLTFALGRLFNVRRPGVDTGAVAQSCITQSLLSEPGTALRGFSLLTFWQLNGLSLDSELLRRTIVQMILGQESSGFTSDVAWALAFCLQQRISLGEEAAQVLSEFGDDGSTLLALHMRKEGLLSRGFIIRRINAKLKTTDLDRDHWLITYESVRQGF